jgi:chemotaxis protein methyltransferase CheR
LIPACPGWEYMLRTLSDQLLSQFSEFVTARFGLHFPKKRWPDLTRKIVAVTDDFGFADAASCVQWLISARLTRSQLDTLACRLTIGETYFFRERKSFNALETQILPALISLRRGRERRLRIWSAGCSTGEEAYSIAIMLHRMIADLPRWDISILATDLNPASLRKAVLGEYGDWSFRGIPHWIKERYFTRNGEGRFEVAGAIRKMVTFTQLNLAEDPYPSLGSNTNAMDIIFCRNVLMYFAPHQVGKVIENFHHSLVAGGWLIVSPCEVSHILFRPFKTVSVNDAIFYRKGGHQETVVALPHGARGGAGSVSANKSGSQNPPFAERDSGGIAGRFPAPKDVRKTAALQVSPYDEALALYRQGLYDEAATKLTGTLSKGERQAGPLRNGKAATLLARLYANKGDFAAALEWAEEAVAINKLDPEERYLQAIIFQEQGVIDAAVSALKKTIYLDQKFVLAHFALANLSRQRGGVKEAAKHLENAASLLTAYGDDDILPGSEGMSARRLGETIAATRESINWSIA